MIKLPALAKPHAHRLWSVEKEGWDRFDESIVAYVGIGAVIAGVLHWQRVGTPFAYGLLAVFSLLGIWRSWRRRRWEGCDVVFTSHGITAFSQGVKVWEVAYLDIENVVLGNKELVITSASNQKEICRGRFTKFYHYTRAVGKIRRANPVVGVELAFPRPEDAQTGWLYDQVYSLAPVEMADGKKYRYRCPDAIRALCEIERVQFAPHPISQMAFLSLMKVTPGVLGYYWLLGLIPVSGLRSCWIQGLLYFCRNDRFVRTPDGIQVIRGKKSWLVRNPSRFRLVRWFPEIGGDILRFRNGWRSYYFDPRLIEEEK